MEVFFTFAILVIVVSVIAGKLQRHSSRDLTELRVERELNRVLSRQGYVVFGDLIIPSISDNIRSTQIDHVIVSVFGIFCIETKSHKGNIYGSFKRRYWKQYLGNSSYELYNPIRQNNHHVKSLEYLLRSRLKSPIHSYVVFPYARNIKVDGQRRDFSLGNTIDRILYHTRRVYTVDDVEAIAKALAYVMEQTSSFRDMHISEVKQYVDSQQR